MADAVRVASLAELAPGSLLAVEVEGRDICLARTEDGEVYALQDNCSHQDFPLTAGTLEDGQVECAWHGAKFDIATGRALSLPAIRPVKTYEVRLEDDAVLVVLD
ncbi:MAG TPA: non-heme iron oxygenase ferredoxin subunit [Longimicrobiales bacterium]|nr:non-heme iron oxygenase ferredoxin subunit [Longimicrobiales bacterium]